MSGRKIIEGLEDAVRGDLSCVVIEGQRWVRQGGEADRLAKVTRLGDPKVKAALKRQRAAARRQRKEKRA